MPRPFRRPQMANGGRVWVRDYAVTGRGPAMTTSANQMHGDSGGRIEDFPACSHRAVPRPYNSSQEEWAAHDPVEEDRSPVTFIVGEKFSSYSDLKAKVWFCRDCFATAQEQH